MYNIKYILKERLWAPRVDSACALVGGNLLEVVVMTAYLMTPVNY